MALGDMELTVVGQLVKDPESVIFPDGAMAIRFTVATNATELRDGKWVQLDPSYVEVQARRSLAENALETLRAGMRVIAVGIWRQDHFERKDGGGQGLAWRLHARALGPDLTFATADVTKTRTRGRQAAATGTETR